MTSDPEIESLNRQLANLRENLLAIDERISEFVEPSTLPLQYKKDRKLVADQIAALERQIAGRIGTFDAPGYADARSGYLAALRQLYGVVQTHAFMALATDERVGTARQLALLGERGVYVPLAFDARAVRRGLPDAEAGVKGRRKKPAVDPAIGGAAAEDRDDAPARHPGESLPDAAREMAERETRPLELTDVLGLPGHLAIIGEAGAGKTTVLHVLATSLALESAEPPPAGLARALPDPRPLPVLLPLRLFELACGGGKVARTVAGVLRFVDEWFAEWCTGAALPPRFLADHLRAGRAWLLLDALDEVADPDHRATVRNIIQDLARDYPASRIVVTARVAGYRGANLDDRFTVVTVRDLEPGQRAQMIRALYRGLDLHDPDRSAEDLIGRFDGTESLRDLGRTPVMVWTAAVIHALHGDLPEGRAALYDAYADMLLKHSFKRGQFDAQSVHELAEGRGWPLTDRRHYLTYAAFKVHELLEGQGDRRAERRIVVGEDELADTILAGYFQVHLGDDQRRARERARDYLAVMVAHSGLIHETPQGYTIGDHLTMQEFLAGCYLGDHLKDDLEHAPAAGGDAVVFLDQPGLQQQPDRYEIFLREKVGESWWREVFLLGAGYLAGKTGFSARNFLQSIMRQGETPAARLAAHALAARGLLQLRALRQRPAWYSGLARQLAVAIHPMLFDEPIEAPAAIRSDAGLALGLLYDERMPDPRFLHPMGLPDFVRIEPGWYGIGSVEREVERLIEETKSDFFKHELPRHPVYLDACELARFPTTNAMYRRFVEDGGYPDHRWWTEAIKDEAWKYGRVKDYLEEHWHQSPRYWDDPRWNNPAQPVVGVNWYESSAFCAWLTATLNDGCHYRLPTEAEWESAARGVSPAREAKGIAGDTTGPRYPWGDEWRLDHCNSQEAGLGVSTPVGIFPRGARAGGLGDMAGNVFEWCGDRYAEDYYRRSGGARNPRGPEKGSTRILRGGSWFSEGSSRSRCGFRDRDFPTVRLYSRGFRCARTLSS